MASSSPTFDLEHQPVLKHKKYDGNGGDVNLATDLPLMRSVVSIGAHHPTLGAQEAYLAYAGTGRKPVASILGALGADFPVFPVPRVSVDDTGISRDLLLVTDFTAPGGWITVFYIE